MNLLTVLAVRQWDRRMAGIQTQPGRWLAAIAGCGFQPIWRTRGRRGGPSTRRDHYVVAAPNSIYALALKFKSAVWISVFENIVKAESGRGALCQQRCRRIEVAAASSALPLSSMVASSGLGDPAGRNRITNFLMAGPYGHAGDPKATPIGPGEEVQSAGVGSRNEKLARQHDKIPVCV